jgi:hypothetical protein
MRHSFTLVKMWMWVLWVVMLCGLVGGCQHVHKRPHCATTQKTNIDILTNMRT